jgi:hypothetical protein
LGEEGPGEGRDGGDGRGGGRWGGCRAQSAGGAGARASS